MCGQTFIQPNPPFFVIRHEAVWTFRSPQMNAILPDVDIAVGWCFGLLVLSGFVSALIFLYTAKRGRASSVILIHPAGLIVRAACDSADSTIKT